MTKFTKWLDTFVDEKELDREQVFTVIGESGPNYIPLEVVIKHMKIAPKAEQDMIQRTIVRIDFANGDVMPFFHHLARAIAR